MRRWRVSRILIIVSVSLWLGLASPAARAQGPRAGSPAATQDGVSRVAAELSATGNLSRGLVYRDLITLRAVVQAWDGPWGGYIQPYWLFSRVGTAMGPSTADNDIYVRTGGFRALSTLTFAFAVAIYEHSLRRKVDHRALAGGGAGVNLWRDRDNALLVSAGVLGEVTDFGGSLVIGDRPSPATTDARWTPRWAVRVFGRYKLGGGRLVLTHDAIALPAFRDLVDDYRILFNGSIDAPVARGFAARVQADATRDGVIVEGTKHGALVITFGVSYRGEWRRD